MKPQAHVTSKPWQGNATSLPEYLPESGTEVCCYDCDRCDNAVALNCSTRHMHVEVPPQKDTEVCCCELCCPTCHLCDDKEV